MNCEHEWQHLETVCWYDSGGTSYQTKFYRIDRFYCKKCTKTSEKKQEGYSRDTPDWYRSDK